MYVLLQNTASLLGVSQTMKMYEGSTTLLSTYCTQTKLSDLQNLSTCLVYRILKEFPSYSATSKYWQERNIADSESHPGGVLQSR